MYNRNNTNIQEILLTGVGINNANTNYYINNLIFLIIM
jgi:hypothetical protein